MLQKSSDIQIIDEHNKNSFQISDEYKIGEFKSQIYIDQDSNKVIKSQVDTVSLNGVMDQIKEK